MALSFIETQLPVSKLSKESYKERKASYSHTLTGLGKWWGRKPLILVRATILGLLMPASDNPKKDREIFLKALTMDDDGLWRRKSKNIAARDLFDLLDSHEREEWFDLDSKTPKLKSGLSQDEKETLQRLAFERLSYDEKLAYCVRPEEVAGLSENSWQEVNLYLGTKAESFQELIQELGNKKFGHLVKVGDAFCGAGSIPFEAARVGCEAYGSDLNPVATLLTWASLNIVGNEQEVIDKIHAAQKKVYEAVDKQITDWGIEHDEKGWRADAYLYCNETVCPECHWVVPLAPSWVISEKFKCIAELIPNKAEKQFDIDIVSNVSAEKMKAAKNGTVKSSNLICPNPDCQKSTSIESLRGKNGLRRWEKEDFAPRTDDVFQERLYFVRWIETYLDERGKVKTRRHYCSPNHDDLQKEQKIQVLLSERFANWQQAGYLPSRTIESGYNTDQPIRERGWTYWHHLFNPRQLLIQGLYAETVDKLVADLHVKVFLLLALAKAADWNSRLCRWITSLDKAGGIGASTQTFYNQALNTLYNYGCRSLLTLETTLSRELSAVYKITTPHICLPKDVRKVDYQADLWITDPPYADAINYHELSDYFLSWYSGPLQRSFPDWYADSKRALAITGKDESFRKSMADCYANLANHMPDNGYQVVMFTHQDAAVWADLALILWASGLQVSAAWCIATETSSALKVGNYVQGTVLLVLRKQTSDEVVFLDEITPRVQIEVKKQLDSMLQLDDDEDPNFGDTDYQLAAYAAALRVLTQYKRIEDIDVAYELSRSRNRGEKSPIEQFIDEAVKTACDYLVPKGFDSFVWKMLTPEERFYLKGLDIESHGEYRAGAYQELARGFGLKDYKPFLQSGKANQTRLKTPTEFATKNLGDEGFGLSLVRHTLFAIREVTRTEDAQQGKSWLRAEVPDYWNNRKNLIEICNYLANLRYTIDHWATDAHSAELLAGAIENDGV